MHNPSSFYIELARPRYVTPSLHGSAAPLIRYAA
jgi:hypothetical protein